FPLFRPSPLDDLPDAVRRVGVQIGDVGILCRDGSFDPIFSICRPEGGVFNRLGVPAHFEQLILTPEDIRYQAQFHSPGTVMSTVFKKRSRDNRRASASENAALLLLPDGASTWDLRRPQLFRNYAMKHAHSWYGFINDDLERLVGNSRLYLVTGVTKSTSW
ncbi:hypothetical protein C8R45DRAFT_787905, partial [Mycena sanguinolenta]